MDGRTFVVVLLCIVLAGGFSGLYCYQHGLKEGVKLFTGYGEAKVK